MLSLLVAARDAENETDRLSDEEIADQIMLFLLAGHDTTSVTLACTLVQLAISPEWQAIVRSEVDTVLHGRAPTAADVDQLTWTSRVIQETMRLYPAAHGMARSTRGDQVLDGYRIPDGSWVEVSPWAVHHAPAVWADPDFSTRGASTCRPVSTPAVTATPGSRSAPARGPASGCRSRCLKSNWSRPSSCRPSRSALR